MTMYKRIALSWGVIYYIVYSVVDFSRRTEGRETKTPAAMSLAPLLILVLALSTNG